MRGTNFKKKKKRKEKDKERGKEKGKDLFGDILGQFGRVVGSSCWLCLIQTQHSLPLPLCW